MPRIAIVTDSTSDIPPDIARELHVTVIPVHVIFGEESFDDGVASPGQGSMKGERTTNHRQLTTDN